MDTTPLENFAKSARRELLVAVEARISTVLATRSVARSERAETVRLLESEIADHGRKHVIDRVAYTWFNRLIALRFMDARGYTDAGVVSPALGQAHGQPEILADAKRGGVDTTVVTNTGAHKAIIGLLDGSRRSTDAEGEAYALLLTEYCRHWHKTMPFMFEAEGAYTELLVPTGLLADGALLSRAREVLTEGACDDVEVIGWLYQFYISERKDEVFAGFKNNKKAGADEIPAATQLFTPHWIVRYLLENSLGRLWMLNRPTSRLVEQMDYYIAPVDEDTDFLRVSCPEELTIIDPACGSGHMLTYAFDLLYAVYEEEGHAPSEIPGLILTHNLHGTEIDPRAGALAAFALTMKARAKDRRFFTRVGVRPKIVVIEPISFTSDELDLLVTTSGDRDAEEAFWNQFRDADTLGSLIQPDAEATTQAAAILEGLKDHEDTLYYDTLNRARRAVAQAEMLSRRYSIFTANPPYMGRGNMGNALTCFVDSLYVNSSWGLDACYIARAESMVVIGGLSALVTMQSWMYLSSFERLRREVLQARSIATLCHLGAGVFPSFGGEVVAVVATVFRHATSSARGTFIRLVDEADRESAFRVASLDVTDLRRFDRRSTDFLALRGTLLAYFADATISNFLNGSPIRNYVEAGVGSQTGENGRFVRFWFEISRSDLNLSGLEGVDRTKWTPSTKGGEFRRWYDPTLSVMDWRRNGDLIKQESTGAVIRNAKLYFRENLSWTKIGTRIPSFRYSDARVIHNDASCFVVARSASLDSISGYLNSRTVASLVKELNPTLNLRPSALLDFPFHEVSADAGCVCRELSKGDWDREELSIDFARSALLSTGQHTQLTVAVAGVQARSAVMTTELARSENAIEREVAAAAGLPEPNKIPWNEHSLLANPSFRYGPGKTTVEYDRLVTADLICDFISYAVGCIFGRYSLDRPGLIMASQGALMQDYLAAVLTNSIGVGTSSVNRGTAPNNGGTSSTNGESDVAHYVTFMPDADNVIPFVDDGWFEDDVVERFRVFLKVAFGTEHFEENLRFVEESLGVKTLRDYFITKSGKSKFYDDHVKRYKKRPIYWMFSSPRGSFNALIYLHRYTVSTVSTVLNEYLREYENKLQKAFERAEAAAAGGTSAKDQKEADRLRKVLAELRDYEHDVLYPLATQQVEIDLDDGVKVNYPKFYPAVKKIAGLETSDG